MQTRHVEIVQDTWNDVVPIAQVAADLFYNRLFEIDPDIRKLFAQSDLTVQKSKLVKALSATVSLLDKVDAVLPTLAELGRRHACYGVQPKHYQSVGQALLETLEKGLGGRWNTEVCEAWTAAYSIVAEQMQIGARSDKAFCGGQAGGFSNGETHG